MSSVILPTSTPLAIPHVEMSSMVPMYHYWHWKWFHFALHQFLCPCFHAFLFPLHSWTWGFSFHNFVFLLKSISWWVCFNLLSIFQCCLHLPLSSKTLVGGFYGFSFWCRNRCWKIFANTKVDWQVFFLSPLFSLTYLYHRSNSLQSCTQKGRLVSHYHDAWTVSDLLTYPLRSSTYPFAHTPKTFIINCLLMTYSLSLCPK